MIANPDGMLIETTPQELRELADKLECEMREVEQKNLAFPVAMVSKPVGNFFIKFLWKYTRVNIPKTKNSEE